jgi:hypothetical protein
MLLATSAPIVAKSKMGADEFWDLARAEENAHRNF